MLIICKSCKKVIDTTKHDFCPKCGTNLSDADEVTEKEKKESKPLFFLNKEADDALKSELKSNGMQIIVALVIMLILWLFDLF